MRWTGPTGYNVFPAHAGMSLGLQRRDLDLDGFPRPRGDEPLMKHKIWAAGAFSPPTRG